MVGGRFRMKKAICATWFRKHIYRDVKTFRRTGVGMCVCYVWFMNTNGQDKWKNAFPVWRMADPKKYHTLCVIDEMLYSFDISMKPVILEKEKLVLKKRIIFQKRKQLSIIYTVVSD